MGQQSYGGVDTGNCRVKSIVETLTFSMPWASPDAAALSSVPSSYVSLTVVVGHSKVTQELGAAGKNMWALEQECDRASCTLWS